MIKTRLTKKELCIVVKRPITTMLQLMSVKSLYVLAKDVVISIVVTK